MLDELFTLAILGVIAALFSWAFKALPREEWQIIACLPGRKNADGIWAGINLSFYGFFNAWAYCFAVCMFLLMMGALRVEITGILLIVLPVLVIGMTASRFIARWVEKKPYTFSVGAASFAGMIIAPWTILLVNFTLGKWRNFQVPVLETLSAMLIAYALGEGIGRLACISFGCCYGKPLTECHPLIQAIFKRRNFVFRGKTKKISYARQLEDVPVVPVQALTAVFYTGTGLLGFYLFLKGLTAPALILTLIVTQVWRFGSEFLRADDRGGGCISAYQGMALLAIGYVFILSAFFEKQVQSVPDILQGLFSLWNPGIVTFLIILWIATFIYTGKSDVTCSSIDIKIIEKNI
jgi:hypothetical protein